MCLPIWTKVQSEYITSAKHNYAKVKFAYDIGFKGRFYTEICA